jgi:hypothetical protein
MLQKFIQSALLLVVLFTTVQSYAQVSQAPDGIQFQALATDANGHPAAGRVIYVKNAIIAKTATGAVVYAETFKVTASSAGIFSIVIGKGTYTSGVSSIANIDWSNGPFFLNLKIAIEPTIPTASWNVNNEYVDMGTSQFWSVPYALYAGNVKGADGKLNTSDTAAMLKPYFTAINLKANIESPTFTGTVKGITKAMVGLANVDNTSDIDKPVSTATQTALDIKANTTDVNTALNLKANAADVTTSLSTKVDKVTGKELSTNDYTTAEKTKLAAIIGTNTGDQDLSALALAAEVNAALASKANAANVASSLAAKADVVAVNNAVAALNISLATKENNSNKSVNITTDAASDIKYPSVKSVKTYVDSQVGGANIADADATTKGKIQLAGDLAGTAAVPTVPGLALKENTANKSTNVSTDGASDSKYPSVKAVKSYVDAQLAAGVASATISDADASTKGKIQLTGDLGGTAAAPTVPGLALKANATDLLSLTSDVNSNTASITLNTSSITAETTRATAAELLLTNSVAANTSSITAETTRAIAAELILTNSVAANTASITANIAAINLKAPIASPTFTGTLTAPIYATTPQLLTSGSTITWNPTQGLNASVTLDQNSTLSFSTTPPSGSYGTLVVTQDGTGGRTLTLPSTTNKVLGSTSSTSIALSTAAGAKDIINFYYDGTNCYWNVGQGYGTASTTDLASNVSGTLSVANGGTGATTLTGLVKGTGTSALTAAVAGTDYQAPLTLTTTGTGAATLSGTTLNIPSVSSTVNSGSISGTIAVASGGTGATTLTGYVKGTGTTAMTASANIPVADVTGAAPIASPTFTGTVTTATINTGALSATSVTSPIYASTPQILTDDATISWNPTLGLNASVTLSGNRTLSFSTTPASGSYGTLVVTQDGTGGRTLTLPSGTHKVLGSATGSISLSATAGAKDILNFYYDGLTSTYYWNVGQGYGAASTFTANNIAGGAAGSIPYQTGSGATSLLAKGSDGYILTLASGIPSWAAAPATGVTSVAMTTPTGLSVSGSPITSSGTLALSLTSGYAIPLSSSQTNWDAAYTNRITSASSPLSITSNALSLGTVPVSSGGTGATTLTGIIKGTGTSALTAAVAGTDFVAPNSVITGATKTKITYDAKGLVTAGADATTADIAPSTNRNYVTDIKAGVLSNTTGTNTGDQTITLTGDVTGIGTGTFTSTIANSAVTYAKMQNVTAGKLLGSTNTSAAAPGEVTIGTGLSLTNGTLAATNAGTVTSVAALTLGTTGNDIGSSVATASTTPIITLNIPDASVSARGVVTTGTQTIAGAKTFSGAITAKNYITTVPANITATTTTALDFSTGNILKVSLGANITTLSVTNATAGTYLLEIIQGGTYTVAFPAAWKWSGGTAPTITATSGKTDIITIVYDGTTYFASAVQNF